MHYAEPGQPVTLCQQLLAIKPWIDGVREGEYTNDPSAPIDCPACLIRALRGDEVGDRVRQHEAAGLRYCFTCMTWDDDTDCFPSDHSLHCGHELKPLGMEMAVEYRLICTAQIHQIIAIRNEEPVAE